MYGLYPDVGVHLPLQKYSEEYLNDLEARLDPSLIIHLYGLSLTGKTTIAQELAQQFHAHCIDEMLIVRSVAYFQSMYPNLDYTQCLDKLTFGILNRVYVPYFDGSPVRYYHLHTEKVEVKVNQLLTEIAFLNALDGYCRAAIEELSGSRIVYVSSTTVPDFPQSRASVGFLFETDLEEVERRWIERQKMVVSSIHSGGETDLVVYGNDTFEEILLERDYRLVQDALHRDRALMSADSYRVNTTFIEQSLLVDSIAGALHVVCD